MRALIIGLGQDGRLMSDFLDAKEVPFRAIIRRSSYSVSQVGDAGISSENILYRSALSAEELLDIHRNFAFTHIFNFAANSFVQESKNHFRNYIETNSVLTWELLKFAKHNPDVWLLQPLSSEILMDSPQSDDDIARCISPRNAYGLSKLVDLHSCAIERSVSGSQVLSPIIFNHESRLRPPQFFSRKLVNFLQSNGSQKKELRIYNVKSVRDWGSAPEYIDILYNAGMNRIIGSPLLGTGHRLSVEQFIDYALDLLNLDRKKINNDGLLQWKGPGWQITEVDRNASDAARVVVANRNMVNSAFGRTPKVFGMELVRQLVFDVI